MAANRYYYACFHAVQGLFIHDKISGHTHAGMIRQFSLYYVKEKLIDLSYGSFLARLMQLRQKADYNCAYDITKEEVFDMQPRAIEFVRTIETLIHRPS
ncbi:MAG: HEPN domain-containing protein [Prevotella sp.]